MSEFYGGEKGSGEEGRKRKGAWAGKEQNDDGRGKRRKLEDTSGTMSKLYGNDFTTLTDALTLPNGSITYVKNFGYSCNYL